MEVVRLLLSHHPEGIIIESDEDGQLPIHSATDSNHEDVARELFETDLALNALELGGMLEQQGRRHDATEPIWRLHNTPWSKILEDFGSEHAIVTFAEAS